MRHCGKSSSVHRRTGRATGSLPSPRARRHADACIDRVPATLFAAHPQMGETVAIDGSDLPAYANGLHVLVAYDLTGLAAKLEAAQAAAGS
jgi:hypothetical protein